jgi:hypothetical protein
VLQRVLQFGSPLCVQVSQPLQELPQAGHAHRQVEPIHQMLRVRAQVALQLAEALLAVREEHQLLVVPQALTVKHRGQVAPGFRIMALDKAETLGWPV